MDRPVVFIRRAVGPASAAAAGKRRAGGAPAAEQRRGDPCERVALLRVRGAGPAGALAGCGGACARGGR